jgi:hypothetical protein
MDPGLSIAYLTAPLRTTVTSGFSLEQGVQMIIIVILLAASALISGAEAAFFSISAQDKQKLDREKGRTPRTILRLFRRSQIICLQLSWW